MTDIPNSDIEIEDPVVRIAKDAFGISYLYPWQRLVIANILDAMHAGKANANKAKDKTNFNSSDDELYDEDGALRGRQIVLLPTGAGKSLCFQIPALLGSGPTLVIYPLLALMGDQKRRMDEGGLDPAIFRGKQTPEEREAQYKRLEGTDGRSPAQLIIANPEVLAGEKVLARIAARKPSHIAIDEAHCVSEWGDSFRPSYLELGKLITRLNPPAVTAFTATASPPVLKRISEVLYRGQAHLVRGEADRPNIVYTVEHCRAKDAALVREVLKRQRPLVVFCATRGGTERVAALLRNVFSDTDIKFYHAGLQKDEKIEVEAWFHGHERAILCTTCAWGMGVDKKDVHTVIHRDAPPTAEAYIQEAGRGGRDGTVAQAILLWSPADLKRIQAKKDGLEKQRALVLARMAQSGECRRLVLLRALGDIRTGKDAPGGEQLLCAGCDICKGTALKKGQEARDAQVVLDYIDKNGRIISKNDVEGILCESGNHVAFEKHGIRYWKRSDFSSILRELIEEGKIIERNYWPFLGTVEIPQTRRLNYRLQLGLHHLHYLRFSRHHLGQGPLP